jgi:hypothetical protein
VWKKVIAVTLALILALGAVSMQSTHAITSIRLIDYRVSSGPPTPAMRHGLCWPDTPHLFPPSAWVTEGWALLLCTR